MPFGSKEWSEERQRRMERKKPAARRVSGGGGGEIPRPALEDFLSHWRGVCKTEEARSVLDDLENLLVACEQRGDD